MRTGTSVLVVGFSLLLAAPVLAQTTGQIEGTVVDQGGAALPGVAVEATSAALQGTKVATTDEGGKFRLVFLPHEDDLREAIGRIARFLEHYRKRHGN